MKTSVMKYSFLLLAVCTLLFTANRASAQCCQGNKKFSLTVTIDGLTISNQGSQTQGKLAPITPGEELYINYQVGVISGTYGENPVLICQLNSTTLVNKQVNAPSGGSFPFYMPTAPGTYYFSCSLSLSGQTPQVQLVVP